MAFCWQCEVTNAVSMPLRILVAEDNRDGADMLAVLLRLGGHEVHVAYDGPHALALIQTRAPHLALLDIGMPGLNGLEIARTLKTTGHRTVLIAISGWGRASDRDAAREAGFADYFLKPVEIARLDALLQRLSLELSQTNVTGADHPKIDDT
jgi:CheY-like chemotaxis protein